MRIRARLFLQGALLPAAGLALLVLVGGLWFRRALLLSVDESLKAQAAVEAISLFDAKKTPHLHLSRSPIRREVAAFAPARAVYDARGALAVVEPGTAPTPESIAPSDELSRPELRTVDTPQGGARELRLGVVSPDGKRYTLLLRAGLGRMEHAVSVWLRVFGLGAVLVTGLLVAVQARASRWWSDRIENMIRHTRRVEAGVLSSRPRPDPYRDEIGELTAAIGRASERLEAARKAQDRLVADAAHELRTPLAAMRAEIDVTLRRPREAEALRETLEVVREEVARLDDLSTRLLDLARLASGDLRLERTDLRPLLEVVMAQHRPLAEARGIELQLDAPPRLEASVDAAAVRQAFANLLSNAIKFSPPAHPVSVRLEELEGRWRLEVRDEGPGIPREERLEVFEPFRRRDSRVEGAGLGLAIVRDVARSHRGEARIGDAERGTRAILEAPVG